MAEWKQLSGEIGLAPDFLAKLKPPIDALFQSINLTLDLLQDILNFVKNFLVDFTQPIKVIIDVLIAQLKALLLDIKQLGVYVTGDWDLIPSLKEEGLAPFNDGYSGFENRMIQKLTNLNDPTRPNFSSASSTLSLFVVGTANLDNIYTIMNLVLKLVEFFTGETTETPLAPAVNTKVSLKKGLFPTKITDPDFDGIDIKWDIAPPPNSKGSLFPSFINPPPSFLIHIRTTPTPWYIGYESRPASSTELGAVKSSLYTGVFSRVYGGLDFYKVVGNNIFYFLDDPNSDIKYKGEDLDGTGVTYFLSPTVASSFLVGNTYQLSLDKDKLPITYQYTYKNETGGGKSVASKQIVDTTVLYIDIISCDTDLSDFYGDNDRVTDLVSVEDTKITSSVKVTPAYATTKINLPTPETLGYIEALKNALAVYFLGQYYLDGPSTTDGMGLSLKTQEKIRTYLDLEPTAKDLFINTPTALFRKRVNTYVEKLVKKMNMPDQAVLKSLESDIKNFNKPSITLAPNFKITPYALCLEKYQRDYIPGVVRNKEVYKTIIEKANPNFDQGKIPDDSIVLYTTNSLVEVYEVPSAQASKLKDVKVFREVVKTQGFPPVARKFLEYLPSKKLKVSGKGAWSNIRFFEDGIPEFEDFIKSVIDVLESLSLGLDGIIKAIKQYIDLISLRIEELQALINKLKGIIDKLLNFKIGANFAILASENGGGTRGIVEALINSESKPSFVDSDSFGFGACFVFGGYPSFLVDLLKAFGVGG